MGLQPTEVTFVSICWKGQLVQKSVGQNVRIDLGRFSPQNNDEAEKESLKLNSYLI
jgi:hypothetical protein